MASWVTYLFSIILSLIAIITTVIIGIRLSRSIKKIDTEHNLPMVDNFLPEFTNGHAKGLEQWSKPMKNGNTLVCFIPSSMKFRDNMNVQEEAKPIKFVVGKGYRTVLGIGEHDSHRQTVIYNHKDPQMISKKILGTDYGEALSMNSIIQKNNERLRRMDVQANKAITNIVIGDAGGQLSRRELEKQRLLSNELAKSNISIPKEKDKKDQMI